MQRITGRGLELQGDGLARARSRVKAAGFASVSGFVESAPTASLVELAEQLNRSDADSDPLPISADHIGRIWRDEARKGGADALERFARRALVGELHRHLADGWPATVTEESAFQVTHALVTWTGLIGHDLEERANAVFDAIDAAHPPAKWLPANADDPIIASAFTRWGPR